MSELLLESSISQVSQRSDAELYALLGSDDRQRNEAFDEIYQRHGHRVFLYCRRFIGDDSLGDDIFQETMLEFLRGFESSRVIVNLPAYILRIARNRCLRYKRDNSQLFVSIEDLEITQSDSPLEEEDLARLIAQTLDLLPEEQREAFVLQTYSGFSYAEIAEVTGVPISTVRNRVVRAKYKVREVVSRYFTDII